MARTRTQPLPAALQAYFDGVASGDLDEAVSGFAVDSVIIDVDRSIEGAQAIREWAADEVLGGVYDILEVTERPGGVRVLLTFRPKGWKTGFRARYDVDVQGDVIVRMDLQYA